MALQSGPMPMSWRQRTGERPGTSVPWSRRKRHWYKIVASILRISSRGAEFGTVFRAQGQGVDVGGPEHALTGHLLRCRATLERTEPSITFGMSGKIFVFVDAGQSWETITVDRTAGLQTRSPVGGRHLGHRRLGRNATPVSKDDVRASGWPTVPTGWASPSLVEVGVQLGFLTGPARRGAFTGWTTFSSESLFTPYR